MTGSGDVADHLRRELAETRAALEAAESNAEASRRELDRRIFHLNSLYDVARELSGLIETRGIMESFLLMTMGVFGVRRGCIFLHDFEIGRSKLRVRGVPESEMSEPARDEMRRALGALYSGGVVRNPIPMNAKILTDARLFIDTPLPFRPELVVLFTVEESLQGLVAFGETLSGEPLSAEDRDLLMAHMGNFLIFMNNTRNFELANRLNADLRHRNQELKDMIEQISRVRLEMGNLERSRERILAAVRREASRIGRFTRLDLSVIVAVCAAVGLLFNTFNPAGVDLVPASVLMQPVEATDVARAFRLVHEEDALVLDARPADYYRRSHIPGAVNIPASLFDFVFAMRLAKEDPARRIIVYGRTISRPYDQDVARMLAERGFTNVTVLQGGLPAWEGMSYEVES